MDLPMDSVTAIGRASNEVGLRCRCCDYALEALAADARCPECGLGVLESELPRQFRFRSWRTIARVRIGLGFLVAAILVSTLIHIGFTFQCRYWLQLAATPWRRWLGMGAQVWSFGTFAAEAAVIAEMMLCLFRSTRRDEGPAWRLARVALVLAALGLSAQIMERFLLDQWGGAEGLPAPLSILIASLVTAVPFGATVLFWLWLTCCVERSRARRLWAATVVAPCGILLSAGLVGIRQFCLNALWLTSESWLGGASRWEHSLRELVTWVAQWQGILGNAGRAVALAGILVFLVRLPRRG
jgi:hypothetical protein